MSLAVIALTVAVLIAFVCWVVLVTRAFGRSPWWGLAVLLVYPVAVVFAALQLRHSPRLSVAYIASTVLAAVLAVNLANGFHAQRVEAARAGTEVTVEAAFTNYMRAETHKAFAMARSADAVWIAGYATREDSLDQAIKQALERCRRNVRAYGVHAECRIAALDNTRVNADENAGAAVPLPPTLAADAGRSAQARAEDEPVATPAAPDPGPEFGRAVPLTTDETLRAQSGGSFRSVDTTRLGEHLGRYARVELVDGRKMEGVIAGLEPNTLLFLKYFDRYKIGIRLPLLSLQAVELRDTARQ